VDININKSNILVDININKSNILVDVTSNILVDINQIFWWK
jgi:hypothetical protein